MRVEKIVSPDTGQLVDHYIQEGDEEIVMTGPIQGVITLADGTAVNVSHPYVAVPTPEHKDELTDRIGLHWVENGHPEDVDILTDPESGKPVIVQRPFEFTDSAGEAHVSEVGTPVGEHPLDYQLGEHTDEQAAAGAKAYAQQKADALATDTTREG